MRGEGGMSRGQSGDERRRWAAAAVLAGGRVRDGAVAVLGARGDVIRDADGEPRLLELELTEPSLFLTHAAGQADRIAALLVEKGSAAC